MNYIAPLFKHYEGIPNVGNVDNVAQTKQK
jgi:hypothetical protein